MNSTRRAALRHILFELRGGFLILPGLIMVLAAIIGVGLAVIEESIPSVAEWSASWRWAIPHEAGVAQYVLSSIAASIMTVLSVVYSVLLLVLTFASMQFSPRIIVAFMRDRVSQVTLGAFLGTFVVCLLTLPAIHNGPPAVVPTLAISYLMCLAVISIILLIYFVHNMALSIQPNSIVQRIAFETENVIESNYAWRSTPSENLKLQPPSNDSGAKIRSLTSGYVQYIDLRMLLSLANKYDVCFYLTHAIGQFIQQDGILLTVSRDRNTDSFENSARRAFHIGAVRTMEDDIEFGVLQIVDIALKAVSPAVNDPSTAIACIDYLGHILTVADTKGLPSSNIVDANGILRIVNKPTSFQRLLNIAFDQLIHYGKCDKAVSLRILRSLREVAKLARDMNHLQAIRSCAERVYHSSTSSLETDECAELKERLDQISRLTSESR